MAPTSTTLLTPPPTWLKNLTNVQITEFFPGHRLDVADTWKEQVQIFPTSGDAYQQSLTTGTRDDMEALAHANTALLFAMQSKHTISGFQIYAVPVNWDINHGDWIYSGRFPTVEQVAAERARRGI